ncbi:1-propanol dehydrogenase PduQ [Streptococcus merionis]|uniref:Iron-containing alcohol dehydrogenase n=1 Tax=Streptococcus merionis TaxID=400065 RepID=A0A239T0B6_9STRE|nr:1-propanol dehydrogenase PduQ [Streptococcus merionis]SNU90949.1 iron-containing alcohol dehydrogenase [Streptococcus merionis]
MKIQEFNVGPKFIFGHGATAKLSELSIKKAYIICDPFIVKSQMIKTVLDILEKKDVETAIFSHIVPDPTIEIISESVVEIKQFCPDVVIAFGGGSAIDAAKAVVKVYTESAKVEKPTVIAIPTTSGTGSENTAFSVVSDPTRNEKYALVDKALVPEIAILDSVYTMSVPAQVTADTGMDVLTHCLEAYVSSNASDFSDACAEKGINLTWKYLIDSYKSTTNEFAREKMHNASSLAGLAFNNAGLGICHSLSHAIGAFFHVPHGRINALLLPHVIVFNASLTEEGETVTTRRYAQIANMLQLYGTSSKQCVRALNYAIRSLTNRLNMPATIEELGIDCEEFNRRIPEMAQRAIADACTPTNPRPVTVKQLEDIYRGL